MWLSPSPRYLPTLRSTSFSCTLSFQPLPHIGMPHWQSNWSVHLTAKSPNSSIRWPWSGIVLLRCSIWYGDSDLTLCPCGVQSDTVTVISPCVPTVSSPIWWQRSGLVFLRCSVWYGDSDPALCSYGVQSDTVTVICPCVPTVSSPIRWQWSGLVFLRYSVWYGDSDLALCPCGVQSDMVTVFWPCVPTVFSLIRWQWSGLMFLRCPVWYGDSDLPSYSKVMQVGTVSPQGFGSKACNSNPAGYILSRIPDMCVR
jgi:hypothetical protein